MSNSSINTEDPISISSFSDIEKPDYFLDHTLQIEETRSEESESRNNKTNKFKCLNRNCKNYIIAIIVLVVVFILAIVFAVKSNALLDDPIRNGLKKELLSTHTFQHLKAIKTNLIDPSTPTDSIGDWNLVFSDEFTQDNRTFNEYEDQFFTAIDLYYQATHDLEYYLPQMITTKNSFLQIKFDKFNYYNDLLYISGMLQSWNKLCFNKQARIEVMANLPQVESGLWPAVWSLGNLARPGYLASTDGIWPYTYNECDLGTLPNQSTTNERMSYLPGQRLSKCTCFGNDHPNIGIGRGAPEIDIIEGLFQYNRTWGVQTVQVAPFDEWWRPDYEFIDITNQNETIIREDVGTVYQESISLATKLNLDKFVKFTMEFESLDYNSSYIKFEIDDKQVFQINGSALHSNEFISYRQITKEPMSLIFNLGLSKIWNPNINESNLNLPSIFYIDYIRIYQKHQELTCDPKDYPTNSYINSHLNAYLNPNLLTWNEAGFQFPNNSLINQCKSPKN
ncbi:uncharacterized protein KGF55_002018 [Candida pseudojiufengensis]|uniref:uncharacterized protein n=1 Tax=Candida pseudojiufengensis TaxID=497109 RepID=UPI0022252C9A|nr:uncharacterized protein KGF55_002018 [Candida pseudojiufengensis]KAI5964076.1 hypothetical protein KGF55_002018 [Candida pseudojiufengensis]